MDVFGDVEPSGGAYVGVISSCFYLWRYIFDPVSPDWAHVYKVTHTAKYRSPLIRFANPSSNASRCVFLASPR